MKSIISMVLALVMLFAFTACSGEKNEQTQTDTQMQTDTQIQTAAPVDGNTNKTFSQGFIFQSNGDGTCRLEGIGTCTDKDIVIPPTSPEGDKVTSVSYSLFEGTDIKSVTVLETAPGATLSFGDSTFQNSQIEKLAFYSSDISISGGANANNLKELIVDNCNIKIGQHAVNSDYIEKIVITNSNIETDSAAFSYMDSLKEVDITGCKLVRFYDEFHDCPNLERVNISGEIIFVDYRSFSNCPKLESAKFTATGAGYEGSEYNMGLGRQLFDGDVALKTVEFSGNAMLMKDCFDGCNPNAEIIWNSNKYTVEQMTPYCTYEE